MEKADELVVPSRIQSPSSITTYQKCPRKYYYSYIECLEQKPSIHLVRGTIAHSVLDKFFATDVSNLTRQNFANHFRLVVQDLLVKEWQDAQPKMQAMGVSKEDEIVFFEETLVMIFNWLENFIYRFQIEQGEISQIFHKLTPLREIKYASDELFVRGVIDVIEQHGAETRIMDYKTSNHSNIDEYRLQLAIYSLLYFERHAKLPSKAGIYFLKENKVKFVNVNDELLDFAKKEIKNIHQKTFSKNKKDYPKHITSLCKWSTGQCDFYDVCMKSD